MYCQYGRPQGPLLSWEYLSWWVVFFPPMLLSVGILDRVQGWRWRPLVAWLALLFLFTVLVCLESLIIGLLADHAAPALAGGPGPGPFWQWLTECYWELTLVETLPIVLGGSPLLFLLVYCKRRVRE